MQNLWSFVTRKDVASDGSICDLSQWVAEPEISVEQGLRLLTIGAAYSVSQEDVLGTLKEGKYADVVILDQNPLSINPDDILGNTVLVTIVCGNVEFCREGNEALCPEAQITSVTRMDTSVPSDFSLKQNYPNPFNPSTTIGFNIGGTGRNSVSLEVINISGRRVRLLVNESFSAGSYFVSWNGRNENGHLVPSGIYFYRLTVGEYVETKRFVLVK